MSIKRNRHVYQEKMNTEDKAEQKKKWCKAGLK